jgi:hypothetical protein
MMSCEAGDVVMGRMSRKSRCIVSQAHIRIELHEVHPIDITSQHLKKVFI